jgi:hypothetical protein
MSKNAKAPLNQWATYLWGALFSFLLICIAGDGGSNDVPTSLVGSTMRSTEGATRFTRSPQRAYCTHDNSIEPAYSPRLSAWNARIPSMFINSIVRQQGLALRNLASAIMINKEVIEHPETIENMLDHFSSYR